jgi:hypothetical protein
VHGKKHSTFRLQQERLMTIVTPQQTQNPEALIDVEPCLLKELFLAFDIYK